tara:strand:+ start:2290 stop:2916 length:627 start_codon:yes stop_codon:yes gene_type:complete
MTSNGKRLGDLLLHAGVITKRQIAKGLQRQQNGDKRKLGDILIDMQYITVEDITGIMMEQATEVKSEQEKSKRDFILQKQILKAKTKPAPVSNIAVVAKEKPELGEDTKFNISIKTMISAAAGVATLVGFYYMMMGEIDDAKRLPAPGIGTYPSLDLRDPSVAWPPSKHQYNDQYDNMVDAITDIEEEIEDLNDRVRDLELKVAKLEK